MAEPLNELEEEQRLQLCHILDAYNINALGSRRGGMDEDVHFALIDKITTPDKVRDWIALVEWLDENHEDVDGNEKHSWHELFNLKYRGPFENGQYMAALKYLGLVETDEGLERTAKPVRRPDDNLVFHLSEYYAKTSHRFDNNKALSLKKIKKQLTADHSEDELSEAFKALGFKCRDDGAVFCKPLSSCQREAA